MPFSDLPDFLHPKLRLFLSVDLVGSTALKQAGSFPIKAPENEMEPSLAGTSWFPPILEFYQEIESTFSHHYNELEKLQRAEEIDLGNPPEIWKNNGDELIYVKELSKVSQTHCLIACWRRTLLDYRQGVNKRKWKGDVKATAWLAGFPISNKEVIFAQRIDELGWADTGKIELRNYRLLDMWYRGHEKKQSMVRDFIGPQIDTGFRLSQLSTSRKFVVSIETAYFLASEQPHAEHFRDIALYFDGTTSLKGVLGGRPYPIFGLIWQVRETCLKWKTG